ncbi:cyclin dependent kinase [Chloropicon primus]|uniref:Cyclin dependent kinase n=2 Tax=Chloropicon primus TaxID=1764295 RepID=A0A5B8MU85_9CHLO|nr:cyclin dependent kinase [Chloropicon primus]|eukprot:QDZ23000.1 cyclin dependent kinase [Chloropicon primus]
MAFATRQAAELESFRSEQRGEGDEGGSGRGDCVEECKRQRLGGDGDRGVVPAGGDLVLDQKPRQEVHGGGGEEEPGLYIPGPLEGCRSVDEFEKLNHIDEGSYGVVYRARDKRSGKVVALKKIKMSKQKEGFPLTSVREINILLGLDHPNILNVSEVVVGKSLDSIFLVMEFMEHDLKGLLEELKKPFSTAEVKALMKQLLSGLAYMHDNWVFHRDLKTSNILYNNKGEVKICDFGLARTYGSPLKAYTQLVVTLWYRAPELLLSEGVYSPGIDVWSMGCIMAELLTRKPLFKGKTEIELIDKVFALLGTPTDESWPGFSEMKLVKKVKFKNHPCSQLRQKFPKFAFSAGQVTLSDKGFDLLERMLCYDPAKRITAREAADHEWFKEVPRPQDLFLMPTISYSTAPRKARHDSPDPLEEQRRREQLQDHNQEGGGLFQF